jgi:16S rRNA (uracil1498-N3)-methyltransferase
LHRFFVPPAALQNGTVHFPPETAHQILHVLRLKVGERVVVLDNLGGGFVVELIEINRQNVVGRITAGADSASEPPVHLSLYLCLTQREKFEWMLQKCTEVGVNKFIPVISARSLIQDAHSLENKLARWQHILQEAAEQSGRSRIPDLYPPVEFDTAVHSAPAQNERCLAAWEQESGRRLGPALSGLKPHARTAVLIGPEGGLTREEISTAEQAGWLSISLGPRILRMETAAVVAAALTVAWFENQVG